MMELKDIKNIYFLGIGGIGMSALARYFHIRGVKVSGYDKTPTELTSQLIDEGIEIFFEENINHLDPLPDLIVYTPAIPDDHIELTFIKNYEVPLMKRSEILGVITKNASKTF